MAAKKRNGKYQAWLKPDKLSEVENWAAKGCKNIEIAHNMGICESTFYKWMESYEELSEAVEKGRAMSIVAIENKAFEVAMGRAKRQRLVKVRTPDGGERVEQRVETMAPSVTMLIFLLKNRAGYSDNPNAAEGEEVRVIIDGKPCRADD